MGFWGGELVLWLWVVVAFLKGEGTGGLCVADGGGAERVAFFFFFFSAHAFFICAFLTR
jgi:hypothetical protein